MKFTVSESSDARCRKRRWLLAFFWISGLITGLILSLFTGESSHSLMRMTASRSVSIVPLLLTTCLPFLFSALAVFVSEPVLLLLIAFCKATIFALVSAVTCRSYGAAGWMIRSMVMFADVCTLPFLYSFWQRHLCGSSRLSFDDGTFMVAALLICSFDVYWISPFLTEVLQY